MLPERIPHYFLYGEDSHQAHDGFAHVERIADRWPLHGGKVVEHQHPHLHQLSYWLDVNGHYHCDGDSHILHGPTLVWMPSGVVHGFSVSPRSDCIVISLSGDFVSQCLRGMTLPIVDAMLRRPLVLPIVPEMQPMLRHAFERVEQEYRYPSWAQLRMIEAQVRAIFLDMLRGQGSDHRAMQGQVSAESALFQRFLALVEEQFRKRRRVADYTMRLGTTPYLLNQATRRGAGMKASDMITARIVQEACRLLRFTALDVAEVAWVLGDADPAHFGRLFRREMGVAPGQWREAQSMRAGIQKG